ncbi:MAG: filamentous hemagglutinin N-terminal domain-containing protein [Gammaproteobacteria bacterium]|nr:filamentous hemagglutinin N-terminal domain-containing protein [Gammaproteobacteria bacterium]
MNKLVFNGLGNVLVFVFSAGVSAEVILDGSLGLGGTLSGPDYQIEAQDGRLAEANLFHSFSRFNLNMEESATFSGPDSVDNIISRVTDGEASSIDGLLASSIPGADLYFLNPAGVMFGPNAALNISGSFHVSTADYLRMEDNERFYSRITTGENLSVAAPAAFGFMDADIAPLSLNGKGEIAEADWDGNPAGLRVDDGKTLSLVGGNIEIKRGTYFRAEKNGRAVKLGSLNAGDGQINLAAAAGEGEAALTESGVDTSALAKQGDITISEKSLIDVAGEGGGRVAIRGERFVLADSDVLANTSGAQAGGLIDIQAKDALLSAGAILNGDTTSTGSGADIRIQASGTVSIAGENEDATRTSIRARSGIFPVIAGEDLGDGGNVQITARNIEISGGTGISASVAGGGKGGTIYLEAAEDIEVYGESSTRRDSFVAAGARGSGDAGNIAMQARNISFKDGAYILSAPYGKGKGGSISLSAESSVIFAGEDSAGRPSRITSTARADGNGGNVSIQAQDVLFREGAQILIDSKGKGKGGSISLSAESSVIFAGENSAGRPSRITSTANAGGNGGSVSIQAQDVIFREGAQILIESRGAGNSGEASIQGASLVRFQGKSSSGSPSGIYAATISPLENAGKGGMVKIVAEKIEILDEALLRSETYNAGEGGSIVLQAEETIQVGGISDTEGLSSYISVSNVQGSSGDAGDIQIETKDLQISEGGKIIAIAFGSGHGGDIRIKAQDTVSVDGARTTGWASIIGANSNPKSIETEEGEPLVNGGPSGDIDIEARRIMLTDGGQISASSIAPPGLQSSDAGELNVRAETIEISGVNPYGETEDGLGSGLYARSKGVGDNAGKGGEIKVQTKHLSLIDGGMITSNTDNQAPGGNVHLTINGELEVRGDSSAAVFKEPAEAQQEYRSQFGDSETAVSGIYTNSTSTESDAGAAGDITLESAGSRINVFSGGAIATKALNAGGGKVSVNNAGVLYLRNGEVTTSVQDGHNNGGDINVNSDFIVQSGSPVIARAFAGDGGNITIHTTGVYRFPPESASPIDASSQLGIDGIVQVHSPDVDVSAGLATLPADYLDAAKWAHQSCAAVASNASSFVAKPRQGMPNAQDDKLPGGPAILNNEIR